MVRFSEKRLPYLVLVVYTALAVMGTFSLAAAEPLRSVNLKIENPPSNKISGSLGSYLIQYPEAELAIIAKTDDTPFSPLRIGVQRIAFLLGPSSTGNAFFRSSFAASAGTQYINLRNNILLKLRI
jgi:hypothetical protein